ncbi:MAG: hypothetical protein HY514_03875 [Candidatus Aenigmarchaeota archaeon]|nr:hypothetical protein [Candidatus Aenigmarchaeota archaeon]
MVKYKSGMARRTFLKASVAPALSSILYAGCSNGSGARLDPEVKSAYEKLESDMEKLPLARDDFEHAYRQAVTDKKITFSRPVALKNSKGEQQRVVLAYYDTSTMARVYFDGNSPSRTEKHIAQYTKLITAYKVREFKRAKKEEKEELKRGESPAGISSILLRGRTTPRENQQREHQRQGQKAKMPELRDFPYNSPAIDSAIEEYIKNHPPTGFLDSMLGLASGTKTDTSEVINDFHAKRRNAEIVYVPMSVPNKNIVDIRFYDDASLGLAYIGDPPTKVSFEPDSITYNLYVREKAIGKIKEKAAKTADELTEAVKKAVKDPAGTPGQADEEFSTAGKIAGKVIDAAGGIWDFFTRW